MGWELSGCIALCPVSSTTASSKSCLDPEFLKAIPIMKTRSGMQVCVHGGHVDASSQSYMCLNFCFVHCLPYVF